MIKTASLKGELECFVDVDNDIARLHFMGQLRIYGVFNILSLALFSVVYSKYAS